MNKVYFLGGPWDGHQIVLESVPDHYQVAVMQPLSGIPIRGDDLIDNDKERYLNYETVSYAIRRLTRTVWVAMTDADWR